MSKYQYSQPAPFLVCDECGYMDLGMLLPVNCPCCDEAGMVEATESNFWDETTTKYKTNSKQSII